MDGNAAASFSHSLESQAAHGNYRQGSLRMALIPHDTRAEALKEPESP